MFLKAQLQWNVEVPAQELDRGLTLQKTIIVRLLETFAAMKATSALGYFLAVTALDEVGRGKVRQDSTGAVVFPVTFTCMTFKVFKGEVLEGEVHKILKQGVFLRCGPIENIFLLPCKMLDYSFVPGDNPMFMSDQRSAKIEKGSKLRVMVVGVEYVEAEKEFRALASLDGDFLGPK